MPLRRSVLLASLLLGAASAAAQTPPPPSMEVPTISVTGTGEVRFPPDMATITVGVVSQARAARDALTANTRAMTEAIEALKAAGIADRDLQTSGFSLQPQYEHQQGRAPRIAGYQVSNTLTVRVRELARLGEVLDRVVTLGANAISGPVFGIAEPERQREAARRAAVADARRRAQAYADGLGVRLGRILAVTEPAAIQPMPRAMQMQTRATVEAAPVPVEAGESGLTASVGVVFEILQ